MWKTSVPYEDVSRRVIHEPALNYMLYVIYIYIYTVYNCNCVDTLCQ
jgi:hypothetical protein